MCVNFVNQCVTGFDFRISTIVYSRSILLLIPSLHSQTLSKCLFWQLSLLHHSFTTQQTVIWLPTPSLWICFCIAQALHTAPYMQATPMAGTVFQRPAMKHHATHHDPSSPVKINPPLPVTQPLLKQHTQLPVFQSVLLIE